VIAKLTKKKNQVPRARGRKVVCYDDEDNKDDEENEEAHSYSRSDSDDLHFQPKGCEGRSSRFGK
jgi:hypothetical protein